MVYIYSRKNNQSCYKPLGCFPTVSKVGKKYLLQVEKEKPDFLSKLNSNIFA